jgi:hypothetical protein
MRAIAHWLRLALATSTSVIVFSLLDIDGKGGVGGANLVGHVVPFVGYSVTLVTTIAPVSALAYTDKAVLHFLNQSRTPCFDPPLHH